MGLANTQKEVYAYFDKNDFVSPSTIEKFRQRLEYEGNIKTLSYAMEKYVNAACPNCGASGAFKWHFLGKLRHPNCGWSWYVTPGTYVPKSLKDVFRAGVGAGGELGFEEDKKGNPEVSLDSSSASFLGLFFEVYLPQS